MTRDQRLRLLAASPDDPRAAAALAALDNVRVLIEPGAELTQPHVPSLIALAALLARLVGEVSITRSVPAPRNWWGVRSVDEIIGPLLEANIQETLEFTRMTGAVVRNMCRLGKPIIAAINGVAAGAGAVLALASDLRVMSDRAKFAFLFTKVGLTGTHHLTTHEEMVDPQLGYQPMTHWFTVEAMKAFAYFVESLAAIKEGDGTLLDNTLVFAHSDQEYAKVHGLEGIPSMTAGKAGGRLKTDIHLAGNSQSVARVVYTVLRAMEVEMPAWGSKSNRTSKEIGEILA